jgi:hypothetical protein
MSNEQTGNAASELQEMLERFLGEHAQEIQALKGIPNMRHALLQQEVTRLSRKLGPAHPRVQRLEERLRASREIVEEIAVEREIARIRVPKAEPEDVLIQGCVLDERNRGWAGLDVHVEDEQGNTIRQLMTKTDASGYYAIVIDPALAERLSKAGSYYITVLTQGGKVVHRDTGAVDLTRGSRAFADVVVGRETLSPIRTRPHPGKGSPEGAGWVVRGRVHDSQGRGIEGVMVSAFDRDRQYDDKLGAALTNAEGEFEITFRKQDFREGREPGPDLYLTVIDSRGNLLYSSEKEIRYDAGQVEEYDIVIEGRDPAVDG